MGLWEPTETAGDGCDGWPAFSVRRAREAASRPDRERETGSLARNAGVLTVLVHVQGAESHRSLETASQQKMQHVSAVVRGVESGAKCPGLSWLCPTLACDLGESPENVVASSFPGGYLQYPLYRVMVRISEILHVECLEQCLTQKKRCSNINIIIII